MRILSLSVKNYGPIRDFSCEFTPITFIVGPNGSGKTWLLELIAGLTGRFVHTELLQNRSGDVSIIVENDGDIFEFQNTGDFDGENIHEFKKNLNKRSYYELFDASSDDILLAKCGKLATLYPISDIFPSSNFEPPLPASTGYYPDSMYTKVSLAKSLNNIDNPILIDNPEQHLDLSSEQEFGEFVVKLSQHQIVIVTHSPSILAKENLFTRWVSLT